MAIRVGDQFYSITASGDRGLWTAKVIEVNDEYVLIEMLMPTTNAAGSKTFRTRRVKFPPTTTDDDLHGWRREDAK